MVGFAVPAFFVSFAWSDTLYILGALLTGLYAATQMQMKEAEVSGSVVTEQPARVKNSVGWRVARSAKVGTRR